MKDSETSDLDDSRAHDDDSPKSKDDDLNVKERIERRLEESKIQWKELSSTRQVLNDWSPADPDITNNGGFGKEKDNGRPGTVQIEWLSHYSKRPAVGAGSMTVYSIERCSQHAFAKALTGRTVRQRNFSGKMQFVVRAQGMYVAACLVNARLTIS